MTPRELSLRRTIPLVLNVRNQHFYLRNFVDRFHANGFRNIVVIDNQSTYPPLLAYFDELQRTQKALGIFYGRNLGPHRFFTANIYRQLFESTPFLYSDPDLEWSQLDPNFLSRLFDISRSTGVFKVGSALTVPRQEQLKLPVTQFTFEGKTYSIPEWESQFWRNEVAPDIYSGVIDTTLHLFNTPLYQGGALITGLRVAGAGFEAKHLPWFQDDPCPAEDLAYYRLQPPYSNWT